MRQDKIKQVRRLRRKTGIRKRVFGTPERPRLSVYRSLNHIYAQIIDDLAGRTLASANSLEAKGEGALERGSNKSAATKVGVILAERAKAAGVKAVAFDRNGFRFHGRVKALADAVREGGLEF